MLELNKVHKIDVLDGMKQLEDNSIDLIITSPPYNKAGFHNYKKPLFKSKGHRANITVSYGGDHNVDCMTEEEYQAWQIEFLNECYRVLKPNGSLFYNHKNRIHRHILHSPYEFILKSKLTLRQEIVWDRLSDVNQMNIRYIPTTERIFWFTKQAKTPRFKLNRDDKTKITEVWRIPSEKKNTHPAPFPLEIPNIIIKCVAQGERIIVLDPFMGSGTTALAAVQNNCDWIGFDIFDEYIVMTNQRIEEFEKYNQ